MHIIIDGTTTQDQFAYAGVGQYTKNIILSLVRLYPDTKFSILLFNNKESTLGESINKFSNVEIVDIGVYRVSGYKNDIWYARNMLPKIKKIKKDDSVYFCPYFWRNFPSDIMPTVLFVHDIISVLAEIFLSGRALGSGAGHRCGHPRRQGDSGARERVRLPASGRGAPAGQPGPHSAGAYRSP